MNTLSGLLAVARFLWALCFGEDPHDIGYDPYD
jgi:hypothetical protein